MLTSSKSRIRPRRRQCGIEVELDDEKSTSTFCRRIWL